MTANNESGEKLASDRSGLFVSLAGSKVALILLVAVGLLLRVHHLGVSLWLDEMLYSTKELMPTLEKLWFLSFADTAAPLYRILMFCWISLFGEQELILRIPTLLFGLSSIVVTYLIAETYGNKKVTLLTLFLLCLSPVHIWFSKEATPYAMAGFFLLLTFYFYRKLVSTEASWYVYLLYFLSFVLGLFSHYYLVMFVLPLSLLALMERKSWRVKVALLTTHFLVGMCMLGMLFAKYKFGHFSQGMLQNSGMGTMRPFRWVEWWILFFTWFVNGNTFWTENPYAATDRGLEFLWSEPLMVAFQAVFFLLLLRGLLRSEEEGGLQRARDLSLLLLTMPVILLTMNSLGYKHLYIERYLSVILPFYLLALSRGVTGFRSEKVEAMATGFLVGVGLLACVVFLYKSDRWTVYKQKSDWSSAAGFLAKIEKQSKGKVYVFNVSPINTLRYYLKKQGLTSFKKLNIEQVSDARFLLLSDHFSAFYLIQNHNWRGAFTDIFEGLKRASHIKMLSKRSFSGLVIYRFKRVAK